VVYETLKENAKSFLRPKKMAPVCGVPAQTIRESRCAYAASKPPMIRGAMGIPSPARARHRQRALALIAASP